jgi:hypothetical protein
MKKIILLIFIITNLLMTGFSLQQSEAVFIKRLQVNIWPEYDRPEVLIIYRIQLSDATQLPIQFSLRIPREAGSPYKVAMKDQDGLLYNLEYNLVPEGVSNLIVFTTTSPELQVEFYDPRLNFDEDARNYQFTWVGNYPIENLDISIQQPRYAFNMTITPNLGIGILDPNDRLVYYTSQIGAVDTGIAFNLNFSYVKENSELSATNLPVVAATPNSPAGGIKASISRVIKPVIENSSLMLAGGLILMAIVLLLVVNFITNKAGFRKVKVENLANNEDAFLYSGPEIIYCSQCGKPARVGDKVCCACGAELHT